MAWDPVWEDIDRSRPWGQYPGEDVIRFVAGNFYRAAGPEDRSHRAVQPRRRRGCHHVKHLLVHGSRK
jgi:hypothetical protein